MLLDLNSQKIDNSYKTKFNSFSSFLGTKSNVKLNYDTYKYKINSKEYFITTGKYEYENLNPNDEINNSNIGKLNSFNNVDLRNNQIFKKVNIERKYRPVRL